MDFFDDPYEVAEKNGEIEIEVWCGDDYVATVSGSREYAINEAKHYAMMAQADEMGEIRCWQVMRKPFDLEAE